MSKVSLNDLQNLQNEQSAVATINGNNSRLEAAMEQTLSRDGTSPNEMNANLDMNGYVIYNLPKATAPTEPVRKAEFDQLVTDIQAEVAPAAFVPFDNTDSGLAATNVQDAIDEVDGALDTVTTTVTGLTTNFNEMVDDQVAALLVAGTGISLSYNDVANSLTIATSGGGGSGLATPQDYGAAGDGVTDDTTAFQNLVNGNSLCYIPAGTYQISSLSIPAGCTIFGPRTAILRQITSSGTFITLNGDNIKLSGFTVDGNYTDTSVASGFLNDHFGIYAYQGDGTTSRKNIVLDGLLVKNFGESGMELRITDDLVVKNCEVHRCGYGGVMCWSPLRAYVYNNYIHDIFPGDASGGATAPFQNAYGGTFSYYANERRPIYSTFEKNLVVNVPTWEGLDEHSGTRINFINNTIINCSQGIAVQHGEDAYPAKQIKISGNVLIGFGASTSYNSQTCYAYGGIVVNAATVANQGELVSISDNNITECGDARPSPGGSGAITVRNVRNLRVNNNSIFVAYRYGIILTNGGSDSILYATINDNIVDGVISSGGAKQGIFAGTRVLADIQDNFLQDSGGVSQASSPTYTTRIQNNRII